MTPNCHNSVFHLGIVLFAIVIFTAACQEDKSPPDDDGGARAKAELCQAIEKSENATCLGRILDGSGVEQAKFARYLNCDSGSRDGLTSADPDIFEVLSRVQSQCL